MADEDGDPTSALRSLGRARSRSISWSLPRFDTAVAILAVLAILLALFLFFSSFPRVAGPGPNPTAASSAPAAGTPNVVGKRLSDAISALQSGGYPVVEWAPGQGQGSQCAVLRQDPPAGTALARGAKTTLSYVPGNDCTKKGD